MASPADPSDGGTVPTDRGVDPAAVDPDAVGFVYDEMSFFSENCAEYGLPWSGSADVQRVVHDLGGSRHMAALQWGDATPRIVFLHGSAQNAHTWDTVVLALRPVPALAIDLPGHGQSSWRSDGRYDPRTNAEAVIAVIEATADAPVLLVGMSLGGLTATRVAALRPDLVDRLVVIDITPGVTSDKAKEIHDFIAGPQTFAGFAEIFDRTVEFNPTRTEESLRRGILHNAHRLDDGSWEWNYHRAQPDGDGFPSRDDMWADVAATTMPLLFVRAADSPVVDDDDVAELRRQRPEATVVVVQESGHSVQGDQPIALAAMLAAELDAGSGPGAGTAG